MAPPSLSSVLKIAIEQEPGGLTAEEMIEMLNSGVTVEGLLRIIQWKLSGAKIPPGASRWVM